MQALINVSSKEIMALVDDMIREWESFEPYERFILKLLKQYLHDWDGDPTKIKKLVDKYAVEDL